MDTTVSPQSQHQSRSTYPNGNIEESTHNWQPSGLPDHILNMVLVPSRCITICMYYVQVNAIWKRRDPIRLFSDMEIFDNRNRAALLKQQKTYFKY